MYDLIGDVHGHLRELKLLLRKLGYQQKGGAWQHPCRKVIFVGDYIDRGPAIRGTLNLVRRMVERGNAIALLGNHEYNALAYHYSLPEGGYLRAHTARTTGQHKATLKQFQDSPEEWKAYLRWFQTLPLYLELEGLRAVHACWDEEGVRWLKERNEQFMHNNLLEASLLEGSESARIIHTLLKGRELILPEGFEKGGKGSHVEPERRVRWWRRAEEGTMGDYLFECPEALRSEPVPQFAYPVVYPQTAPPVFIGHYSLTDRAPALLAPNIACLDYGVARKDQLVAYRWNGEKVLHVKNFVRVASKRRKKKAGER